MNVVTSSLPLWAVIIPILGAIIINRTPEDWVRVRNLVAVFTAIANFLVVASILPMILGGSLVEFTLVRFVPGLELFFRIDPLGIIFAFTASLLWIFAVIYSIGYMSRQPAQGRFFTFFIISMSATMGVAFSGNLFTMYIFFEYLTLCTYPLVVHSQTEEATKSGIKYIAYCFGGGGLILFALIILQGLAHNSSFVPGGILSATMGEPRVLLIVIFFMLILGFGTKGAIMPLHSWLPAAMVAPAPVSALLHAVAVVKSGIFGMIRVLYFVYGPDMLVNLNVINYLAVLVCFTIIAASILALRQNVFKLRLAYSTIGQLGYITLGALMLTPIGLLGGVIHIINHALMKIVLFFCAGAVIRVTGKTKIDELKGVGKRMPLTMLSFAIAGLGLIGILPINGYISKMYLLTGALQADRTIFVFVLLLSSILNSMYYLPIIVNAFFREGEFSKPKDLEAPLTMLAPIVVLALMCVFFGLFAHKTTIPMVEYVVNYVF
ncbi:MAG: proton-conducting transporter membrane subunit [Bacillota bacterium]|nr:proton-conducting transporter membrane subunit [Bacillota bacterium]